jgi:hypothetical protein
MCHVPFGSTCDVVSIPRLPGHSPSSLPGSLPRHCLHHLHLSIIDLNQLLTAIIAIAITIAIFLVIVIQLSHFGPSSSSLILTIFAFLHRRHHPLSSSLIIVVVIITFILIIIIPPSDTSPFSLLSVVAITAFFIARPLSGRAALFGGTFLLSARTESL